MPRRGLDQGPNTRLLTAVISLGHAPARKRTDHGLHVTAAEAYRLRQTCPGPVVLIDIRSRVEAVFAGQPELVDTGTAAPTATPA